MVISQLALKSQGIDSTGATTTFRTDAFGRQKISHAQPDPVSATLTAVGHQIAANIDSLSDAIFYLYGAAHAGFNLTFEQSPNSTNGTDGTWFPVVSKNQGLSNGIAASVTGALTTNSATSWSISAPGALWVRARVTAFTSGSLSSLAVVTTASRPTDLTASISNAPAVNGVTPGVGVANLGKAEDATHASGDHGVAVWGVRNDNAINAPTSANGDYSYFSVDSSGAQFVREKPSSTSAVTSVNASVASVNLLAANAGRRIATIYNDSTAILYLKLGITASTTSFTVKIPADGYYEVPENYSGLIDAIWAAANGAARITEVTA